MWDLDDSDDAGHWCWRPMLQRDADANADMTDQVAAVRAQRNASGVPVQLHWLP